MTVRRVRLGQQGLRWGRPTPCHMVTPLSRRVHVPGDEVQQILPPSRGRWGKGPGRGPCPALSSLQGGFLLPQAFYMIRFHSFYPWHTGGDYMQLCSEQDLAILPWVQEFK